MNILQAKNKKQKQMIDLYLPKEVDLAINLIHTFIKNIGNNQANTLGLKLAIILSGARSQISYDKNNRVRFEVDELCDICKIKRRQLSSQLKKVIDTKYYFVDTNGDSVGTTPIHTYRYTRDSKYIYISVSAEAKKLFGELGKGGYRFTQALTDNLFNLKHKHSLRMQLFLEMINNYNQNSNKRIEMNLDELNGYFGVKYKNMYDIERKILIPVQKEITHSSSLTFKYDFKDIASGGRPKIDKVVIDVVDNSNNLFALDYVEPPQKQQKWHLTEDLIVELSVEFGIAQTTNKSLILEFEEYLKEQEQIFIKFCKDSNRQYSDMNLSFKRHIEGARQAKIDFFTELR